MFHQMWYCTSVIPALGMLKKDGHEFKVCLLTVSSRTAWARKRPYLQTRNKQTKKEFCLYSVGDFFLRSMFCINIVLNKDKDNLNYL